MEMWYILVLILIHHNAANSLVHQLAMGYDNVSLSPYTWLETDILKAAGDLL